MAASTSFHDLDAFIALPRATGLALSPDGTRLVTRVATLNPKRTGHVSALWQIDPTGAEPARRLTRSAKGEGQAVFAPTGEILFLSARPDPDGEADDEAPAALWALPEGGEARIVASAPGGVEHVEVAGESGRIVALTPMLPGATTLAEDAKRRKARKDAKVQAILHASMPVRFWDTDLGPDAGHLVTAQAADWRAEDAPGTIPPPSADDKADDKDAPPRTQQILTDVTPQPGKALLEASYDVTRDGSRIVTMWQIPEKDGCRMALAVIDAATGERRIVVDSSEYESFGPVFSPDGSQIAFITESVSTHLQCPTMHLAIVPTDGGEVRTVAADWDRWPSAIRWLPDASALVVTADDGGRSPIFLVDVTTGDVRRLTQDGAFSDVCVSPDGATLYALRTSYLAPPEPVRVEIATGTVTVLPAPAPVPELPGTLTEVTAVADDGRELRAWLALPEGASKANPAPLAVWIHGGPLSSWNAWSWRWCPWLLVAAGYAVVLPDPALSTGYGQDFIQVGWNAWGEAPYTDVLTLTDATCAREDVDETRTCAMGGSFGGYMANWVAGHTDRFRAIVTHASLWALDQFKPTTDAPFYWRREMDAAGTERNDPHLSVENITTPLLVVHGDNDYRVPISEGVRLFSELAEHFADDDGQMPHRFLYFPDENHWVLKPQNAKVWYQTVVAFLAQHVLGEAEQVPDLLR